MSRLQTAPWSEAVEELVDALLWVDRDRVEVLLDALPRDSVAADALAEAVDAWLCAGRGQPLPDLDRLAWLGEETGQPILAALCLLPTDRVPADRLTRSRMEQVWSRVEPHPNDPVAQLVWLRVASVEFSRRFDDDRLEHIAEGLWEQSAGRPALAAAAAHLRCAMRFQSGDWRGSDHWNRIALEHLHERHTIRRLTARIMGARVALRRGDLDAAYQTGLAALADAEDDPRRSACWDLVLEAGHVAEAVDGLQPLADAPDASPIVRLRYLSALMRAGRHEEVRRRLEDPALVDHQWFFVPLVTLLRAAVGLGDASDATAVLRAAHSVAADQQIASLLTSAIAAHPHPASSVASRLRLARLEVLGQLGEDAASADPVPAHAPLPVGPFDLIDELGRGAHGRVYAARHHASGMLAAVKVLPTPVAADLEEEARTLARLRHPNILAVHGMGRVTPEEAALSGGQWTVGATWMAMEHVRGSTLQPLLGTLSWPELRAVLQALLEGLAHAHGAGVLHLDLKPANVLVAPRAQGRDVKLADFGVHALLRRADASRTAGTPAYMAPELWSGDRSALGPHTDLYALGALAFELLTGKRAFRASDLSGYRALHLGGDRPELAGCEGPLRAWVERLLARRPGQRFASAADALRSLPVDHHGVQTPTGRPDGAAATFTFAVEGSSMDPGDPDAVVVSEASAAAGPMPSPVVPPTSPLLAPRLVLERLDVGPVHGLEPQLAEAWRALQDAVARGSGRVLGLEGPGAVSFMRALVRRARTAGLAAHHLDAPTLPALGQQTVASLDERTGFRRTPAPRGWRHVRELMLDELAAGAAVLTVVPSDETREMLRDAIRRLADGPCLVVTTDRTEADLTLHLPRLSDEVIARTLQDRLPLATEVTSELTRRSGGDLDAALRLLQALAEGGGLEAHRNTWQLRHGAALDAIGQEERHARWVAFAVGHPALARELMVPSLAGQPVPEDLRARVETATSDDLFQDDGRVIGPAERVLAVQAPRDARVEALAETTDPFRRAGLLEGLGRAREAYDTLLAEARTALAGLDVQTASRGLRQASELGLPLTGLYYIVRGRLALASDAPEAAAQYLLEATTDPALRAAALYEMASTRTGADCLPLLQQALDASTHPRQRCEILGRMAAVEDGLGHPQRADALFARGAAEGAPPDNIGPRAQQLWHRLPPSRQDAWWDASTTALDQAGGAWVSHLRSIRACAQVMWGATEPPDLDGIAEGLRTTAELMWAIARDDDNAVQALFASSRGKGLGRVDWAWTAHWWLDAGAPAARWATTVSRWPMRRVVPAGQWILHQAAARAPDARRRASILEGLTAQTT